MTKSKHFLSTKQREVYFPALSHLKNPKETLKKKKKYTKIEIL